MAILSRKTCLKALLLAVFALQIYGVTASSRKVVSVEKLTPHEIEEELQVLHSHFYFICIHAIVQLLLSLRAIVCLHSNHD
jgi:hypothetical protein